MRWAAAFLLFVPCFGQRVDPVEFFEMKVRPVLARNCFSCHTQTRLGGLEMVSRESLLKGGKSGPAVDTERPENSLLVRAIRHTDPKLKMPPNGTRLSEAEILDIVQWIGRGAVWPSSATKSPHYQITPEQRAWWAFQPLKITPGRKADDFIVAALKSKGLKQVRPASRRDWLRRVTFDLTGLPPTSDEVATFEADKRADARARVVDRLLASPRFGEKWGRHWLDVARYSDDKLNPTEFEPYENAFRYRDWVIKAFNDDMPYDLFVKAQLAGDVVDENRKAGLAGGLGFFALSPQFQDDRVEVTGKAFLGLTVACAQCHDHKFDPIPTRDYYALLGVFTSTEMSEFPLAPDEQVREYQARKKAIDEQKKKLDKFLDEQAKQFSEILAHRAAEYWKAARAGDASNLDKEILERWKKYLRGNVEHPFINQPPEEFQATLLAVFNEQKDIEEKNLIRLGGSSERNNLARADLLSLPRDRYLLWRDFFSDSRGILYLKGDQLDRFLGPEWKAHADSLRAELDRRKKLLPEPYPYYHVIKDRAKPRNERIRIRGSNENLGEEAPRSFLTVLCGDQPKPFQKGSGRLELAESILASPLAARVMANRVWHHLFGAGIVRTLTNFGQLGERPSHPELLDHLASRLMELKWSTKSLIRELVLTGTYALSHDVAERALTADPENRLLWRATRRRLDFEALRDSMLAAAGELDLTVGGKPLTMDDKQNHRRTVYTFVSRRKLDGTLALFDFPNPNSIAEQRIPTSTPLQQLFFLNSTFVADRAKSLAEKTTGADAVRIRQMYRRAYARDPDKAELEAGLAYVNETKSWPRYAQVLLSTNEFSYY